ncbi:MAG: hypothetical protein IPI26_08975 [Elusimicrobia bacterium]|nr:hypothetical protein [Elusimicrobiota bacterium]
MIGYAIDKANEVVKELNLPPDWTTGLLGKAKGFRRMMKGFLVTFGELSFIFMDMVLALPSSGNAPSIR